ncbi:DNA primase [Sphingomonas sp. RB56-2]|uniref:DNA primase n=1 Tax=Sphingomonas brevis TaxID=2908206 RepID=A0ABT0S734_9SPHN|nr:DNA primase [Sphingomonas brevis]
MTLSPAWLDELRARTTLSAVIGPSVKLIKAGREFKACCPFHNEKTPSFTINDEKGFYHCFGCGAHGDAIRFLTDQRGLPFMDAVKELAGKAGMEVPAPDPRERERQERSAGLHDVMEAAARWFTEQLDGVDGAAARDYLKQRGITDATKRKFGFGFAPDSRGKLKTALKSFGEDRLVEAGLLIAAEGKQPYDRFRGRLTYPIRDARGRCIAFSARILGPGEPKYLNSPDTPLFDKGRTLFNLDQAGPASRQAKRIVIVEGQMDAIALDQAGIGEVVAPLGTALTDAQLERLWRLDAQPICCFDGDSAGQKAAVRAATRALPHLGPERTLRFVALPAGQDPDDLVRSGGKEAIDALLAAPEPLVERLWRHEVDAAPLDTPEARAGLKQRLMEHAGAIGDPNVRQLYRDEWLRKFDALVRPQRQGQGPQQGQARSLYPRREWKHRSQDIRGMSEYGARGGRFAAPNPPALESTRSVHKTGIEPAIARALLSGFILYPEALHDHVEELAHLNLVDRGSASLRDQLVQIAMSGQHLDRDGIKTILGSQAAGIGVRRGAMRFSFTQAGSNPEVARSDLGSALEAIIALSEIEVALSEATTRLKQEISEVGYAEQQRLMSARKSYNDRLALLASSE